MKVGKIYFDMDGVLADFNRGVRELCGMEPEDPNRDPDPLLDGLMWVKIKEAGHFYDKLELMPGAKEMFDRLWEKYGDKCEILTGVPKPKRGIPEAGDDKIAWVRRLLSKEIKMNIVLREEKIARCTGPEAILIDDLEKTVREWREKGGTGILHRSAEETLAELERLGVL